MFNKTALKGSAKLYISKQKISLLLSACQCTWWIAGKMKLLYS